MTERRLMTASKPLAPRRFWILAILAFATVADAATVSVWSPTRLDRGGRPGGDLVATVSVSPADDVSSMEFAFDYDPSVASATGAYLGPLAKTHTLSADLATPGVVRLRLDGPPLAGAGEVAWVTFHIAAGGGTTTLTWTSALLNGGAIPATTSNGSIPAITAPVVVSIPDDAHGSPATALSIPVSVDPVEGVSAIDLRVRFDPSVFSLSTVTRTPITAGASLTWNSTEPGNVLISLYQTSPFQGSGPVVQLEGTITGAIGKATPLDVRRGDLDEQGRPSVLDDGLLRVCEDVDRDGDGITHCGGDCNDSDSSVFPGNTERCNGLDDNCDGLVDERSAGLDCDENGVGDACQDDADADGWIDACDNCPQQPNADQANQDADAAGDACDPDDDNDAVDDTVDCLPWDPTAWSVAGEVAGLAFNDRVTIIWEPVGAPGATSVTYDTLRSAVAGNWVELADCVEANGGDLTAFDEDTPVPGGRFFYLVRGRNACGTGSLGQDSAGTERAARACP